MKEKVFKKNEVILREGDVADCFYQITDGTAGVYLHYGEKDQQRLTLLKAGQYFGEMAIIEAWPRSATVVAEGELHTIELVYEDLISYFEQQPDKILALMNQLGERLRELTAEYNEVNAFLKERENPGPVNEGFLARRRKYKEYCRIAQKFMEYTAEEKLMQESARQGAKAVLPVRSYRKGDIIFRENDKGAYMYQIQTGSVGIDRAYGTEKSAKLTTLYTNQFFGEMGLVAHELRSATAVVEEDGTELECIRAEDLQTLFKENPVKVDMILSHLANRLRRLTVDFAKACEKAAQDD